MVYTDVWPYLGALGRLVRVPGTASEDVDRAARYVESTTVEGRRRVQALAFTPRSWSVSVPVQYGDQTAPVEAFMTGAWGRGPWHWVPVAAQLGNMLTPAQASLEDHLTPNGIGEGGPVQDADGVWAPRSVSVSIPGTAAVLVRNIPVIEGQPVTYSADVQRRTGTPGLTIGFYGADGASTGVLIGYGTAANGMQRMSLSGTVPAGTVEMGIGVHTNTARLTRPQVTWTAEPVPYASGHGCRTAVIDSPSQSLTVVNSAGMAGALDFTVMEVS